MNSLNTQTIQTITGTNPVYAQSGHIAIPLPNVMMAKPVSYQFRVAEFMKDGKIDKVALQVQVWEHDNYGSGLLKQDWTTVERVQVTS